MEQSIDRYWFLTNTCYGNWLPGDHRGFAGRVMEHRVGDSRARRRIEHSTFETEYDEDIPRLEEAARRLMKGPPITLNQEQALVLLAQFQETARYRHWELCAVAVMFNHFHIVVGVPGDPDPGKILGDFKSYATRKLSLQFREPPSITWWTERGSKRKIEDEASRLDRMRYTLYGQPDPLVTWSPGTGLHEGVPPS